MTNPTLDPLNAGEAEDIMAMLQTAAADDAAAAGRAGTVADPEKEALLLASQARQDKKASGKAPPKPAVPKKKSSVFQIVIAAGALTACVFYAYNTFFKTPEFKPQVLKRQPATASLNPPAPVASFPATAPFASAPAAPVMQAASAPIVLTPDGAASAPAIQVVAVTASSPATAPIVGQAAASVPAAITAPAPHVEAPTQAQAPSVTFKQVEPVVFSVVRLDPRTGLVLRINGNLKVYKAGDVLPNGMKILRLTGETIVTDKGSFNLEK